MEQVCLSNFLTHALPISIVSLSTNAEHGMACSFQSGIVAIVLLTVEAQGRTGQRNLWPDPEWVQRSILSPFSGPQTRCGDSMLGMVQQFGSACERIRREAVQKTRHPIFTLFVLPGGTDFVCSQGRMAKKKAPSRRSATWARVQAPPGLLVLMFGNAKNF
jgi:hypothetical protein